jgi:NTE family protein
MTYRAFVAFSGGGAKGVVHVGALKALEERAVHLAGLSGTSAGSIVAALAAAGFKADELINTISGRTILDALSRIDPKLRKATDLFGGSWWRIRLFRAALAQPLPLRMAPLLVWCVPPLLGWLIWRGGSPNALLISLLGWGLLGVAVWIGYRSIIGGLASVRRFRNALDTLLQAKLFPEEAGRVVRMGDFGHSGRPTLKIVSANLSRGALHLFSPERTPDTPVADAVAASICLPVIFVPWKIDGELHVDGGIVSNLPAWPFDEERELDPEALTIAVEIQDIAEVSSLDRFTWWPAAIRTALFGSSELNMRLSGPAEHLALPTRFELLDFDKSGQAAAREVHDVASAAGLWLDKRLLRLPEIYRNACQVTQALVLDGLGIVPGGRGDAPRVRVAVARLEREYVHSLRLSHSVGFDDDTDELMLVPLVGSVAGAAWRERQSIFETYPLSPERDLPGHANRLRRKARWGDSAWIMCIPICEEAGDASRLLVQIDGNSALASTAEMAVALQGVEEAVKDFFRLVLSELRELEDTYDAEKQHISIGRRQRRGRPIGKGPAAARSSASNQESTC